MMAEKNSGDLVTILKMETFSNKLGWNWFEYQGIFVKIILKEINFYLYIL